MKTIRTTTLLLLIVFTGCTKYGNYGSNDNTVWDKGGEKYYNNVLTLQTEAGEKYSTWSQTMDSLQAIKKLQEFFLDDTTVTSATIGSQGIAVQYSNGMRGGIFLNPEDNADTQPPAVKPLEKVSASSSGTTSLVNNIKVILLNPSYWDRSEYTDPMVSNYQKWLPLPGFTLQNIYKNTEATVDRFTGLSGYGIVHIYSHGWAWPDKNDLKEVYLKTGEVANLVTSAKYWKDIVTGDITAFLAQTGPSIRENVYYLSPKFIENHNDFSKDTVLFYGGFCYSYLGSWSQLYKKFAGGCYFGFTWAVYTSKNAGWATSLIASLADTLPGEPNNSAKWWGGTNPPKSYFYTPDNAWVSIVYTGDPNLTLWKEPDCNFTYEGRKYGYRTYGSQTWMTENLAYLPKVDTMVDPYVTSIPRYFVYGYSGTSTAEAKVTANYTTYGVLYDWYAAKTACPPGWHLPSDAEWTTLTDYLSNNEYGFGGNKLLIAKSMASASGWISWPDSGAVGNDQASNNRSGFNALPAGYRNWNYSDFHAYYNNLGNTTSFWSSSEKADGNFWYRHMIYYLSWVRRESIGSWMGFSVRCLKD